MADSTSGIRWWKVACAAGLLALAGCGSDAIPVPDYDCCLNKVWYVCSGSQNYGRCLTLDPSGCTQRNGACPPGT